MVVLPKYSLLFFSFSLTPTLLQILSNLPRVLWHYYSTFPMYDWYSVEIGLNSIPFARSTPRKCMESECLSVIVLISVILFRYYSTSFTFLLTFSTNVQPIHVPRATQGSVIVRCSMRVRKGKKWIALGYSGNNFVILVKSRL